MATRKKISIRKLLKTIIRGDKRLIVGFFMRGDEVPGWKLLQTRPPIEDGDTLITTQLWTIDNEDTDKRLKLEIVEAPSMEDAPESMQHVVDQTMSGHLLQPGDANGVELGDVSLVNPAHLGENEILEFLTFTRSNVTYKFNSIGKTAISALEFAKGFDAMMDRATSRKTEKMHSN